MAERATVPGVPNAFTRFDAAQPPSSENPWQDGAFVPDLARLQVLIGCCAAGAGSWAAQEAGGLGLALDLYAAGELRRSGYEPDAVWPRAGDPRVIPAASARAIGSLLRARRPLNTAVSATDWNTITQAAAARVAEATGSSKAVIHGEFFPKEVDVLVADWDRGVELLISTKSMTGSYGNNMNNRWEEFVGDVRNIRGRFPLATLGVLFLVDHSIIGDNQFERLLDMLRKLRISSAAGEAYDATALVIAEAVGEGDARLLLDKVPEDLRLPQFFEDVLTVVFTRLPVSERRAARRLRDGASPTAEANPPAELSGVPAESDD